MKITAEPRSDQINADDLIGGPMTVTIKAVHPGKAEQKYDIELVEVAGRAWRPPVTVLRILLAAWGDEAKDWIGQRVTLYRDDSVRFGPEAVGGIRVSHMTGLPDGKPMDVRVSTARGKRATVRIQPLAEATTSAPDLHDQITKALAAFESIGVSDEQLSAHVGKQAAAWAMDDLNALSALFASIRDGQTTVADVFTPIKPGGAA